jgi:hypothetical protein
MTANGTLDDRVEELGRASRRAAAISLLGFLLVIAALTYAMLQLRNLERKRQELEQSVKVLQDSVGTLERRSQELLRTQNGVLDFLGGVTAGERIRLIDRSVDWERTKRYVMALESGPRKDAILAAVLLAWKELPFSLENRGLSSGLDSPHFIEVVLSRVGVQVKPRPRERLSDAMMRQFSRVESPLPGDLIFYRGNVGSFVLMYMGPGSAGGKGIAVGTLQTGEEVQVLDTANINTPVYPFIGFFRVPYAQ